MEKLNKEIKKEDMKRIRKCVVEMSNVMNCVRETGITYPTLQAIFDRGFCSVEQLKKLTAFCDSVENVTA